MSTTQACITNASIVMDLLPGDPYPLRVPEIVNLALTYNGVSNIQRVSGSYTPANDTGVVHTFGSNDQANFMLLVLDQPAVVTLTTGSGTVVNQLCVQKFIYMGLETVPSGYLSLSFNGHTSGPELPMQQGVKCNYLLYYGVAKIS